jgi:release factor glutamine methyltransferase
MSLAIDQLLESSVSVLATAGVESPRLDARILASAVLKCSPNQLLMQSSFALSDDDQEQFLSLINRRCAGEPVSRILGVREFWSMPFKLSLDTLDPRPDSETLVEVALSLVGAQQASSLSVLDAGTGTGCLLLALLSEWSTAIGVGIDVSHGAIVTARANAIALALEDRASFFVADWLTSVEGIFDVVVSNPPYIREDELPALAREVRSYDPLRALLAGPDGLSAYRSLMPDCERLLRPDGVVVMEIGFGQEYPVKLIMEAAGLTRIETHYDLSGVARCLSATAV